MTWTQRLERVFNIDISTCNHCGGNLKSIAAIENPAVTSELIGHQDLQVIRTVTMRTMEQ
jgi:hypothetical protein